jgi:hypothetical protein
MPEEKRLSEKGLDLALELLDKGKEREAENVFRAAVTRETREQSQEED